MKKKIISIFSGIDALGLGFREHFDIILAVEKEKKACETLIANKDKFHPNLEVLNEDILSISNKKIAEYQGVTGIIGGPPCQPFSSARGEFDPNNDKIKCLFEFARWVNIIQPKFFMFENVKGLISKDKIAIFELFLEQVKSYGYKVEYKVLNSHDYGNAQSRERIVIVGFQKDLKIDYRFPEHVSNNERKYVRDILDDKNFNSQCEPIRERIFELLPYIPEGGNWRSLKTDELLEKALGVNFKKRGGGMTGVCRRLHRDKPCPTLVTSPVFNTTLLAHPLENRALSVTEYKRGQGIPDDYKIVGSIKQQYKFIGNAVPVEMSHAIAKSIHESMLKYEHINRRDLKSF